MSSTAIGIAAAALAAFLFGTVTAATTLVLRSFDPVAGAMWRGVVAAAILVPIIAIGLVRARRSGSAVDGPLGRSERPLRGRVARALVIGVCGGPLFVAGLNLAVDGAGPTIAGFVNGLYAVFAALIAPFVLREPLRRRILAGFATALLGTALLSGLDPSPRFAGGFAAGVAAALIYSLYLTLGRRWGREYGLTPEVLTVASVGSAVVILFAWTVVVAPATLVPTSLAIEAVVGLVWVGAVWTIGQVLVQSSVRRISAARSAAFLLINPITAAFLGVAVLGDRLSPLQMTGAVLLLVGMAVSAEVLGSIRALLAAGRSSGSEPA